MRVTRWAAKAYGRLAAPTTTSATSHHLSSRPSSRRTTTWTPSETSVPDGIAQKFRAPVKSIR